MIFLRRGNGLNREVQAVSLTFKPVPSVQLPLRHRRLELGDLRGPGRLAVEGQDVAGGAYVDMVAVLDVAGEDHLGQRILDVALDHALEGTGAVVLGPAVPRAVPIFERKSPSPRSDPITARAVIGTQSRT